MNDLSVSTVVSAASSYDLTDLAAVKTELKIASTTDDAWLGRAITQASRGIANFTNRVLVPEVLQDRFDLSRRIARSDRVDADARLKLSRWPVLTVVSVTKIEGGITTALVEGTDFLTSREDGALIRLDASTGYEIAWERSRFAVVYMAGYGSSVSEAHSVPGSPYQVTVDQAASFSCDLSVARASGVLLSPVTGTPAVGQYKVSSGGVYTFSAADSGAALTFAYGVRLVPDDLVGVALRLVTERWSARGRDPTLIQRETPGVGVQRFWFGGAPGQKGQFPPDLEAMLSPYCVPVIG